MEVERRKKYQVFTPRDTVNLMLDEIDYFGETIIDKTIVDISCGDGAFLIEALKRYIKACQSKGIATSEIVSLARSHIYGYENDEHFYSKCQINMQNVIKQELGITKNICFDNIKHLDGLTISNTSFDYVVGNPPYLSYREMTSEQREYLQQHFVSCKEYKYDYSYAFIEKSINLLNEAGVATIIAPINMYKIKSGKLLREFLRTKLYRIIDVTEDDIFHGVLTNPVISLFSNRANLCDIDYKKNENVKKIPMDTFYRNESNIINNHTNAHRFGDYYSVHNGVATLLNSAFIVIPGTTNIEKDILRRAVSPKEIRYKTNNQIIFPYSVSDGIVYRYEEKEFMKKYPKTCLYLFRYRDRLEKRDVDSNTKWFEYGRSQALSSINNEKIMVSSIMSKSINPILLNKEDIVYAGFFIISKDPKKYTLENALSILNSKKLYEYIARVGVKMNGKSYRYSVKDLENYMY